MASWGFRNLDVYIKAVALSEEIGVLVRKLPQFELFELSSQMRRADDSTPSNISEGHARGTRKEFINFLHIASGSNLELQTQLMLCVKHGYLTKEDTKKALAMTYDIARMLRKLIAMLKEKEG